MPRGNTPVPHVCGVWLGLDSSISSRVNGLVLNRPAQGIGKATIIVRTREEGCADYISTWRRDRDGGR